MEKFIMANDTALRISDSGRGETTLALLHGYLESLEVWEDLAKRLAPYYRIVAIDIPGHGISQVRGEVHTMDFVADTLQAVLEKLGVAQIPAQDQPFDPQKHNAVMHVEDESVGENTIVEVFQQGYELGDKVLRFAMVKVAN